MYRLNITFVVEPRVQERWLALVREKFMPLLRERGFGRLTLSRVVSIEAVNHFTYSLLVELESMAAYTDLTEAVWREYTEIADPLFGVEVVWFMSLLKEIE